MAKKNKGILVRLVSTAQRECEVAGEKPKSSTGYFLVKKRNPKTQPKKLEFKKYDPVVRKHVLFKEEKIK